MFRLLSLTRNHLLSLVGTLIIEVYGGHGPSELGAAVARGHDGFKASVTDPDPNDRVLPELGCPSGVGMSSVAHQ